MFDADSETNATEKVVESQEHPEVKANNLMPGPDSSKLKFPIGNGEPGEGKKHSLDLEDPPNVVKRAEYDTTSGQMRITRTIGDSTNLTDPEYQSLDEYLSESNKNFQRNYFQDRAQAQNLAAGQGGALNFEVGPKIFEDIFGNDFVDIKPQGSAELIFMGDYNRVDNPGLPTRAQRNGQFKFDQKIRLNVLGKIGDRVNLNLNYDTEASFEFDQMRKLDYQGKEDDIVKLVEVGDINLPIQGSLIQGSSKLFGIKTKLQFGKLSVTGVVSRQNTERKEITVEGGAQKKYFNIPSDEYDANRHFFLAHFFRDHYNEWAGNAPLFVSPVQITRVEVWVTNETRRSTESRNIVGFMDMAEFGFNNEGDPVKYNDDIASNPGGTPGPDNDKNKLYEELVKDPSLRELFQVRKGLQTIEAQISDFEEGQDYEFIDNAKRLNESEYTLNDKMGYISLRTPLLNDEVLAVAVEYNYNGVRHQIGEFSRDYPSDPQKPTVLFLKMLKARSVRTDLPLWDLMMKNVYSLNYGRIEQEDFRLEVIYADDESGADMPFIPEPSEPKLNGKQLIRVLDIDKVNKQGVPTPDGVYDFIEGLTVLSNEGKIIFPVLEPFGDHLRNQFENEELAQDYVYDALYDSIQASAIQQAYFNKFFLRGFFKGTAGDEILLNSFNIQPGSVKVTAGGVELQENQQYTVDYSFGRVKIIDQAILSSGQQIKVSHESNTLFAVQQKGLYGTRLDYKFNEDFNVGGTLLYLRERPITQKVNVGDEPLQNTIWGLDGSYRTESQYLTKLIDKLPFLETKEVSEITVQGEMAHLIPGHPKVIGETGTSYLDDFEGSEIPYPLGIGNTYWKLASTPQGQLNLFPNGNALIDKLEFGYHRAKIAWYTLDPIFYITNGNMPEHIRNDPKQRSNHYVRQVLRKEVFPQQNLAGNQLPTQATFDISFFPKERGPYNFDFNSIDKNGNLKPSDNNWGGIMRKIETNNFEAANIQYLEFWMMDPFIYDQSNSGEFYINLGNVSEDVLKDGRKSFENGLPGDDSDENVSYTGWGRVPVIPNVNNAFDNDPSVRESQDVGLDGMGDRKEADFYREAFLKKIEEQYGANSVAYQKLSDDPSGDNYHHFQGDDYNGDELNIIARYKLFNNTDGNSPVSSASDQFSSSGSLNPDDEDINQDFTLSTTEDYFQYKVELSPEKMKIGQNYITDIRTADVELANGNRDQVNWYQFKVPINKYEKRIGNIVDFKSIRFIRLFLRGFEDSIICRFAQLQLIRSDWRQFTSDLGVPGEKVTTDPFSNTVFNATTVNIEENSERQPIPYVLPPDIFREQNVNDPYGSAVQNEQSLSLYTCDLADGDARAVFKNTTFDVRQFKRMKMFVHGEGTDLQDGDLSVFIRLGTDLTGNYYEYEWPLKITANNQAKPEDIWPTENDLDLALDEFFNLKIIRDQGGQALTQLFEQQSNDGQGLVKVLGNPDLSNLRVVMIGVKNPAQNKNPFNTNDDGLPKCGEVWVNELRLTDFNQQGGWAANARVTAKLADFGRINVAGQRSTIGFGGVEQTLLERSQEDVRGFDVQTQFALDKFFPENFGLVLPMYYDYSYKQVRPRFNPVQPDVLLESTLAAITPDRKRDFLRRVSDIETRRSLNFINVQKKKTKAAKKSYPWDISNVTATYKFTETIKSDIYTVYDSTRNYTGILGYSYAFKQKAWMPLKRFQKYKSLKILSDFNINYLPNSFSFQGQVNKRYNTILFRNNDNVDFNIPPNYDKTFDYVRNYTFKYDLTKSLKFNYSGNGRTIIDELPGYQPLSNTINYIRDSREIDTMQRIDRLNVYAHTVNLNYALPINKIPILSFAQISTDYKGGFNWSGAPPAADSLGHTISNSANYSVNGQFNFVQLYNKSKFLRTVNSNRSNYERLLKAKEKKLLEKAKAQGKETELKTKPDEEEEDEEEKPVLNKTVIRMAEVGLRTLMMVRNVSANYSITDGTILPGFIHEPQYIGQNFDLNAPGIPFVFGIQDSTLRFRAAENGWLATDTTLFSQYISTHTENLTVNATLEPFKAFRVTATANRRFALRLQEGFRNVSDDINDVDFRSLGRQETGNFSMSFMGIRTSFVKPVFKGNTNEIDYHPLVEQLEDNRFTISERLAREKGREVISDSGYYAGYGSFSQDVLIPAFLAAYSGQDAGEVETSPFWDVPLPNWRVSYAGLGQIKSLKKYVRSASINHSYRSTYTVSNFISSLTYEQDQNISPADKGVEDYLSQYQIQSVSITENFAPLGGVDITWKNGISTKFEYQKSRTAQLNFSNFQVREMSEQSIVFGLGYKTKEMPIPFLKSKNGKKLVLKNDLNIRADVSIRENREVQYQLDQDVIRTPDPNDTEKDQKTVVNGTRIVNIAPTIDYKISKSLNLRIFYTRNVTEPANSLAFPRRNSTFGFSIRYTLMQ